MTLSTLPSRIYEWKITNKHTNGGHTYTLYSTSFDINEIREYTDQLGTNYTQQEEDDYERETLSSIHKFIEENPDFDDISSLYDTLDRGFSDHYPTGIISIIDQPLEILSLHYLDQLHEPSPYIPTSNTSTSSSGWTTDPLIPDEDDTPF